MMVTMPSSGGPSRPWLRSSKSLQAKSSSRKVSRKISSSSKERSTIGISRRVLPDQKPMSNNGVRRPPAGTLVVAVILMVSVVESRLCWVKKTPPQRAKKERRKPFAKL
jgi:hypothetical protein